MPTRPQTWRWRTIYDGFEHAGLRTEIAPGRAASAGRVVRLDGIVLEGATPVGRFTRMLATGPDGLRARHERIELVPAARGRGFARALHEHAEAAYVRMGVAYVTMHAEDIGSLLWPRLGFDFDLRQVEGATEAERRARAVLKLLAPDARKVAGQARPAELLASHPAAAALRERLPTQARIDAGDLGGLLLHPATLAAFDADAGGIGVAFMRGASWDAYKQL